MNTSAAADPDVESVVLLDEHGRSIGTADKRTVHHRETPLHLAFSCYVFDPAGRLLVTRRALHKATFSGVWTNSCCGHPGPDEGMLDAVRRRVGQELGLHLEELWLVLPGFRYRAVMPNGVTENEMCPVFVATSADVVRPDPEEVEAAVWEPWPEFRASVLDGTREVSSWCLEQVTALPADLLAADPCPLTDLPPAARP